jgi:hypothetical protein
MAGPAQKDLVARLADVVEPAMKALADAPGADRVVAAMTMFRERLDDLQKRVRGLEALEQRLTDLEERVDKLSAGGSSSTSKSKKTSSTSRKTSTAKKSGTTEASSSRAADSGPSSA